MEWWVWGHRWQRVGDVVLGVGMATAALGLGVRALARRPPPPSAEEVRAWRRAAAHRQRG